jgi:hypothetical protein
MHPEEARRRPPPGAAAKDLTVLAVDAQTVNGDMVTIRPTP